MVVAGRLDQGDRTRQRAPVARTHLVGELLRGQLVNASRGVPALAHQREDLRRGARNVAARAEHRADTRGAQELVVAGGNHAPDDDHDVACALRAQRLDQLGHERLVARGLARHPDDVHVVLDRFARRFVGRLEQRADVDVEAEIGERGRDHLGTPVVTVLTELGHEDARAAALGLGELFDLLANRLELFVARVGAAVDP